jgi:hypothetical protein
MQQPHAPSGTVEQHAVGTGILWVAALTGPCAWFLDLVTRYFLVESGWASRHEPVVVAVGIGFALLAAFAGLVSFRNFKLIHTERAGARLVAALGAGMGAFSCLVIIAALLPHGFLPAAANFEWACHVPARALG